MFNRKKVKELEAKNSFLEMMVYTNVIAGEKKMQEVNNLKKELSETKLELAKAKQENVKLKKELSEMSNKYELAFDGSKNLVHKTLSLYAHIDRLKEDLEELGKRIKEYESKKPLSKKNDNCKRVEGKN